MPAATMYAAVLTAPGDPEVIQLQERPLPVPAPGEALIRVRASAMNRADLLQRRGRYPAPAGTPADIGGLEFAGEVMQTTRPDSRWKPGDRVFGIVAGGAHATHCTAPEETLVAIPPTIAWPDAGATPEAFMTAHDAMCVQGRLVVGETVSIHAVASGVGLAAVQLARAVGARTFGTTRTASKLAQARALGLDEGLVASADDPGTFVDAVRAFTGGRGVHVTLDLIGGAWLQLALLAAAPRGRILSIGAIAGGQATLDLRLILARRLTIIGTVLRSRSLEEKAEVARAFEREVLPLLANGTVHPVIDSVLPFTSIVEAHRRLESNETVGKVVLVMD